MASQLYQVSFYDQKNAQVVSIPKTVDEIVQLAKDASVTDLSVTYNGVVYTWRSFINMISAQEKEKSSLDILRPILRPGYSFSITSFKDLWRVTFSRGYGYASGSFELRSVEEVLQWLERVAIGEGDFDV